MRKIILIPLVLILYQSHIYAEFTFTFKWGDIPMCTTGNPNRVNTPIFEFKGLPDGVTKLTFRMIDKNVPTYNHGGGKINNYDGSSVIEPGAFKYKSPCPPNGKHTYEWVIKAYEGNKKVAQIFLKSALLIIFLNFFHAELYFTRTIYVKYFNLNLLSLR